MQSISTSQIDRDLQKVESLLGVGNNLEAKQIDLNEFSRILVKLPGRNKKENVDSVVSKLFEIA